MVRQTLEVTQWWGDEVLDTAVFTDSAGPVTIGLRDGMRWRFLGVDMGWVSRALAPALRTLGPGWSEVSRERATHFAVPDVDEDAPLCEPTAEGWVVRVPDGWVADRGGAELTVDEAGVTLERAPFRFELRTVAREARVENRMAVDPGLLGAAGTVLLALLTVGLGTMIAPPARAVATGIDTDQLLDVVLDLPPPPAPAVDKGGRDAGAKAKKAEGARAKSKVVKPDRPGRGSTEEAKSAGILGADVLGGSDLPAVLVQGIGSLIGGRGNAIGGEGLGNRAGGLGGGGTVEGIGGLGPRGNGPGGPGIGGDGIGKSEGHIDTLSEDVILVGQLDHRAIDEVVKRNLNAIRYCYQRELQKDTSLAGKVTVKFTISGDGSVSAARTSGSLQSDAVQTCITGRFLKMQFPEPRGHGIVVVSYPFLFGT